MSTQQQALIVETVLAFRKALKRKAYDSDSDSSIEHTTNRGYKLKKRARFVKQGRLAPPTGPAVYKEIAEHAGYQRAIINENPPLIDEDGYDLDSDDNEERVQEAIASAMDENPYASIHLEQLLAPLTAVTDLPTHPTLSRPFHSKALAELINQGRSLMHKENAALWKAKPLLTRLIGDNTWAPCGMMLDTSDYDLFTDTARFLKRPANSSTTAAAASTDNADGESLSSSSRRDARKKKAEEQTRETDGDGGPAAAAEHGKGKDKDTSDGERRPDADTNGQIIDKPDGVHRQVNGNPRPPVTEADGSRGDVEMAEALTAAQGGSIAGSDRAGSLESELFIHPLFLAPRSAHPERDLSLPEQEAEDVRRLLQLYVQKQEEVCRGTRKLYEGLLQADRYRRTVWQWAKAEAHCGPNRDMSDGEDWYDKEEWGLSEDLKKGEDEVEEDTAQTQKKTRNRRRDA